VAGGAGGDFSNGARLLTVVLGVVIGGGVTTVLFAGGVAAGVGVAAAKRAICGGLLSLATHASMPTAINYFLWLRGLFY